MLDHFLESQSKCCLDWNLAVPLEKYKGIWMDIHLVQCVDWWLEPDKDIFLKDNWDFHLDPHLNLQIPALCLVICLNLCLEWYLECILEIMFDTFLNIFCTSISMVLGFAFGNHFDRSIGLLFCYSIDLELGTLIGIMMRPLLDNNMGKYI